MITFDTVQAQLITIVAERPDHIYSTDRRVDPDTCTAPRCLYVHGKATPTQLTGGCIVGEWLHRFGGMSLAHISILDGLGNAFTVLGPRNLNLWMTPKARLFLYEVQKAQDNGQTWQSALMLATSRTHQECFSEFDALDPDEWDEDGEL